MLKIKRWRIKAFVIICIAFICLNLQLMDGQSDMASQELTMVESVSEELERPAGRHSNDRRAASIKRIHRKEGPKRRRVRFTVRLHLPSLEMSDSLSDRNSDQYVRLSDQLSSDIERLFADTPGMQRVHNMRFRPYKRKDEIGQYTSKNSVSIKRKNSDSSKKEIQNPSQYRNSIAATDTKTIPASSTLSPSSAIDSSSSLLGNLPDKRENESELSSLSSSSSSALSENLPEESEIELEESSSSSPSSTGSSATAEKKAMPRSTASSSMSLTTVLLPEKSKADVTKSTESMTEEVTTSKMAAETSTEYDGKFNVQRLTRLFKECYVTSGTRGDYVIMTECYINAYMELMGIFQFMGPVFAWAGDDVRSKLGKLNDLRKADVAADTNHYETMRSMFAYEYSPQGKIDGVETNKWLHLALKFISGLVKALSEPDKEKSMGDKAKTIYGNTLAPHHDWFVRMGVYMALLSFPSRDSLLPQMNLSDSAEDRQKLLDLASVVDAVFDDVQKLYDKYES